MEMSNGFEFRKHCRHGVECYNVFCRLDFGLRMPQGVSDSYEEKHKSIL